MNSLIHFLSSSSLKEVLHKSRSKKKKEVEERRRLDEQQQRLTATTTTINHQYAQKKTQQANSLLQDQILLLEQNKLKDIQVSFLLFSSLLSLDLVCWIEISLWFNIDSNGVSFSSVGIFDSSSSTIIKDQRPVGSSGRSSFLFWNSSILLVFKEFQNQLPVFLSPSDCAPIRDEEQRIRPPLRFQTTDEHVYATPMNKRNPGKQQQQQSSSSSSNSDSEEERVAN